MNVSMNSYMCLSTEAYYVTWGARADAGPSATGIGAPLPPHGKALGKLAAEDFQRVIEKGLVQYSQCYLLLVYCTVRLALVTGSTI